VIATPIAWEIDWRRMAEPQSDGYDTEMVLKIASSTTSDSRGQTYVRTPVGHSPAIFDGHVAIRPVYHTLPEFQSLSATYPDAPLDHPNINAAEQYIRNWPAAFAQCQRLLEAIHPAIDPHMPLDSAEVYRGSLCHSYECLFGTLWATIFCSIGLAEAIVHEMAHQKLRVLGVSFESASALVGNDPTDLYVSPIIKERLRPMTAVLHAQYSYVYVTALDVRIFDAERDPYRREVLRSVLSRNLARIQEGYDTLRQHFKPGLHGLAFIEGLYHWTLTIIEEAKFQLGSLERAENFSPSRQLDGSIREGHCSDPRLFRRPSIDVATNSLMTEDGQKVDVLMTLENPSIVLLGNVLSSSECDSLVQYCDARLEPSLVVADANGTIKAHPNRTSRGVGLRLRETELIAKIQARLAALVHWPIGSCEGLQVLKYQIGEEYRAHFDWIDPNLPGLSNMMKNGGQRLATMVIYLNDVEAGGDTSFPSIGLRIIAKKGAAVFFLNSDFKNIPDQLTLHAGSPVLRGVKFIANKWFREMDVNWEARSISAEISASQYPSDSRFDD
jgi:prolyl 4-hydroxylase